MKATIDQIPRKWRWHYNVLLALRERLIADEHQRLTEAGEPLEPHSMHPGDTGTDEFDHDMALRVLSSDQDALFEVEEALGRIVMGTFGICEKTGQPIAVNRLKAMPWTRFSSEAEADLEKSGEVPHTHLGPRHSVRE